MRAVNNKINWDNAEYVNEQFRASGYIVREFARRMNVSSSTAHYGLKKVEERGLLEKPVAPHRYRRDLELKRQEAQAEPQAEEEAEERDLAEEVYLLLKKRKNRDGVPLEDLADTLDVSPRRIREALGELEEQGRHIMRSGDVASAYVMPGVEEHVYVDVEPQERLFIGVLGDTHFGSLLQQPTLLTAFMERSAERFDLACWIHCGDATDGQGVYRGQVQELWLHGADDQAEYFSETYPDTGVSTYMISGNHDYSHVARGGADVIRRITDTREDIIALGHRGAYVDIGGVSAYVWHPTGGSSYAKSYKVQKRCEAFSDTDKPSFLLTGHLHQYVHVWHRNIHAFLVPSWQQTSVFIRSLGYESMVGGMVLEVGLDDHGDPIEVTPHLAKYKPVDRDFPRW